MLATAKLKKVNAVLACAALFLLVGCGDNGESAEDSEETPRPAVTNAAPATNAAASTDTAPLKPQLQKLVGRWLRADGGYMLEIKGGSNNGQLEAAYYNPNPIRVSKAMGVVEGETTKMFVELQDIGYPGCTYTLLYDATTDQLYGQYYQASQVQTYEVTFERYKGQ